MTEHQEDLMREATEVLQALDTMLRLTAALSLPSALVEIHVYTNEMAKSQSEPILTRVFHVPRHTLCLLVEAAQASVGDFEAMNVFRAAIDRLRRPKQGASNESTAASHDDPVGNR